MVEGLGWQELLIVAPVVAFIGLVGDGGELNCTTWTAPRPSRATDQYTPAEPYRGWAHHKLSRGTSVLHTSRCSRTASGSANRNQLSQRGTRRGGPLAFMSGSFQNLVVNKYSKTLTTLNLGKTSSIGSDEPFAQLAFSWRLSVRTG